MSSCFFSSTCFIEFIYRPQNLYSLNKYLIMDLSRPNKWEHEPFMTSHGLRDQVPTSQHSSQSPLLSGALSSLIFCCFSHNTTLKQADLVIIIQDSGCFPNPVPLHKVVCPLESPPLPPFHEFAYSSFFQVLQFLQSCSLLWDLIPLLKSYHSAF